ncbi:hypothetical protein [Petrimonas sp.]|uniref:hypothetical protein n=1 Tax=Petrimonas sp. TaxID=2023866 RepID=UPI003F51717D
MTNNEKEFIGCDSFGKPVVKFQASPNMFVANNKLYAFDKDSFWELDLTSFAP